MSRQRLPQRLPLAPIMGWLTDFFARDYNTFESVAEKIEGIDPSTLRRWVQGDCKSASVTSLDTFLTAVGRPDLFSLLGSD